MKNNSQEQPGTAVTPAGRPNRRAFVVTAAAVCGAAAFWSLRHPSPAEAKSEKIETGPVMLVQFSPDGKETGRVTVPRVFKTDAEWQHQLSPESYDITRRAGTEMPFTGEPKDFHEKGIFNCVCCDNTVFNANTKFESGTGWPSFWKPIAKENIIEITDTSLGMARTAVSCRRCNAHLGHVFDDGPPPTGLRYCMNWAAMRFVKSA